LARDQLLFPTLWEVSQGRLSLVLGLETALNSKKEDIGDKYMYINIEYYSEYTSLSGLQKPAAAEPWIAMMMVQ